MRRSPDHAETPEPQRAEAPPAAGTGARTLASTVAEALCLSLAERDVTVVFGHPGGTILPTYDALHRLGRPRHVLVRHEQAAAHAADGYARASGRVGVCMATSGPGATNLVTGLATAMMDGVPVVAITGQVPTSAMGTDAFQETDILGVCLPITKHAFLLTDPAELEEVLDEAFAIACEGRPGPVLIDIPKDVQTAAWGLETARRGRRGSGPGRWRRDAYGDLDGAEDMAVEEVARRVDAANRPVVLAGRGVIGAGVSEHLLEMARRADLPVTTTLLGLDAFPATESRALGMPGMHGTQRANLALQDSDLVVGLGARFDDRVIGRPGSFAPHATVIHFDIDPAAAGRTVPGSLRVLGDLRETLPALVRHVADARRPEWWKRLSQWERWPEEQAVELGLTARGAARAIAAAASAHAALVVTDVGQHQMLMAQELRDAAPRTHLSSGGLGTMGYAVPAAVGAAMARPELPVWVIAGDGGFQMTLQELATIAEHDLPLRIVVMNNGYLGMVRQWQELFYERRYSATRMRGPDLVLLAAAYGLPGRVVTAAEDLPGAVRWANDVAGPSLLDVRVPQAENVYPMVPAGAALHELIGAPAGVAR